MRIALIASEALPWCKTGGLADVLGALPAALREAGADEVALFLPLHRGARAFAAEHEVTLEDTGVEVAVTLSGRREVGRFLTAEVNGTRAFLLDHPGFYDRTGLYTDERNHDYPDNAFRYAFLARGVIEGAEQLLGSFPDVVHAHDWQAGLAPVYLRTRAERPEARAVFTIHNLAYQGAFVPDVFPGLDLDPALFTPDLLEFYGHVNFLKGGVAFADAVTTVSPSYACEIQTPARGEGLDGFLRHHARRLTGITNGLDLNRVEVPDDKSSARDALLERVGWSAAKPGARDASGTFPRLRQAVDPTDPVLGVVARFVHQKGLDLVADLVPDLERIGARLVVLGRGEPELERRLQSLAKRHKKRCSVTIGYDPELASAILAGSDLFLVPSRFEPCGLTQQIAMACGTPPVVHNVGGLADTVGPQTGFRFNNPTHPALRDAIKHALETLRDDPARFAEIQEAGRARDASWARPAGLYMALYRSLWD